MLGVKINGPNGPGRPGPPANGMEALLRGMGLGEVLEWAKTFAQSGALQDIITFAKDAKAIQEKLDRQNVTLEAIAAKLGIERFEPDTGSDIGGFVEPEPDGGQGSSSSAGVQRDAIGSGEPSLPVKSRRGGSVRPSVETGTGHSENSEAAE